MSRDCVLAMTVILMPMLTLGLNIQPAKAEGLIVVDGSLSDWIDTDKNVDLWRRRFLQRKRGGDVGFKFSY